MAIKRVGRPRIGRKVLSPAERAARRAAAQRASGKIRISIWIKKETIETLRIIASSQGISIEDAFENLIDKEKAR